MKRQQRSRRESPASAADASDCSAPISAELKRTMRALRTLSAGNRTLLRANDESDLLHEMCRVIVEEGGYCVATVGYAERDERKTISLKACVGLDPAVLQALPLTWAESGIGQWAVATAIRTGEPSVGRHLLTEPAYASIRDSAEKAGYAAATALPLRVDGEIIGALGILAADPEAFDDAEMKLLGELADDLGYGIANLRTRVKHREAEKTIERMAFYDTLTGLPNRVSLRERLNDTIANARHDFRPLALLVIKMGQFQEVNETLGYAEGDSFLRAVALRLAPFGDDVRLVARVGEDEFAALLPGAGSDKACEVAQQMLKVLREPVELSNFAVDARPSVGIALFPGHGADAVALLRRANVAAGQARHVAVGHAIYTGHPDRELGQRLALMGELRRAIANDELRLYCQPKVHFASGHTCGAEALVRWQHPKLGMLATGEFIQLAEHAGLITPLTQWVLEEAFRQAYAWAEAGVNQPMSVNLSAHDLRDPQLVDRIKGLFSTWGTPPELMQFELTESVLMEEPASALEILCRLKALGVTLFVDDYGTGYSSLSYLQRLPVDSLKIDQSFVANMLKSDDSAIIVHSTIDLGHNLGLEIVAEGVEEEAVWQRLASLGCDTAQGYFISRPIPAAQFPGWEAQSRWHARC